MYESVEGTDPFIDTVINELLNNAHSDRVELEERQKPVEEGRVGSRIPQIDSDDDFVVAPVIVALLRRPPYNEYYLRTIREVGTGSVI